jgi:hypothetical protein
MVAFARWIDGAAPHAPPEGIVRTVGQFVRGPGRELGWRSTGSQRGDHDAYANRVRRTLDYLAVVGWVDSRSWVATEHREGLGILVVPGPCSSTGAAAANGPARRRACERRSRPDARRPVAGPGRFVVPLARSFRDLNCPPPPGASPTPPTGAPAMPGEGQRGRAREAGAEQGGGTALDRRERRAVREQTVRAALAVWLGNGHVGTASAAELLEAVPVLAAAPPVVAVREVFRLALPDALPIIGATQRRRLEAAIARGDRYGAGDRAGLRLALDVALGDWQDLLGAPPRTLGGVAVAVRKETRRWRRGARRRRPGGGPSC